MVLYWTSTGRLARSQCALAALFNFRKELLGLFVWGEIRMFKSPKLTINRILLLDFKDGADFKPFPPVLDIAYETQLPRFRYQLAPTFPPLQDLTERADFTPRFSGCDARVVLRFELGALSLRDPLFQMQLADFLPCVRSLRRFACGVSQENLVGNCNASVPPGFKRLSNIPRLDSTSERRLPSLSETLASVSPQAASEAR